MMVSVLSVALLPAFKLSIILLLQSPWVTGASNPITTESDNQRVAGAGNPWITDPVSADNVEQVIFYSDAVGGDVSFHIYLPDAYAQDEHARFPVLYWLHGGGGGIQGIPHLRNYFHFHMGNGSVPPMIVVFPWGLPLGMWVDSKSGHQPVESMLMNDLIPYVDNHFRTIDDRKGRLVEGFSMGGYGAARLGLLYHDRFAGFSMLGAGPLQLDFVHYPHARTSPSERAIIFEEVYGNDSLYFEAMSPWRIAETVIDSLPPDHLMRQVVGEEDKLLIMNRELKAHWNELGLSWQYMEVPDIGHVTIPLLRHLVLEGEQDFYETAFGNATSSSQSYDEKGALVPFSPVLHQNYPNPFNPETTIRYQITESGSVRLKVHDLTGRLVATLVDSWHEPGTHAVTFHDPGLSSGLYFYSLKVYSKVYPSPASSMTSRTSAPSAPAVRTRKMMLLK